MVCSVIMDSAVRADKLEFVEQSNRLTAGIRLPPNSEYIDQHRFRRIRRGRKTALTSFNLYFLTGNAGPRFGFGSTGLESHWYLGLWHWDECYNTALIGSYNRDGKLHLIKILRDSSLCCHI